MGFSIFHIIQSTISSTAGYFPDDHFHVWARWPLCCGLQWWHQAIIPQVCFIYNVKHFPSSHLSFRATKHTHLYPKLHSQLMHLVHHTQILWLCPVSWRAAVLLCPTRPLSLSSRAAEVSWLPLRVDRCTPCEGLVEERRSGESETFQIMCNM